MGLLLPNPNRDQDWSCKGSLETVLTLVNSGGSLRRAAQNLFRSVQFSVGKRTEAKSCDVKVRGKPQQVGRLMRALPAGIGEGIETMVICASLSPAFTRAISQHCTGLRNLSFQPISRQKFPTAKFCALIAARGAGLEVPDVSGLARG